VRRDVWHFGGSWLTSPFLLPLDSVVLDNDGGHFF